MAIKSSYIGTYRAIDFGNPAQYEFTTDFSISCWVKYIQPPDNNYIPQVIGHGDGIVPTAFTLLTYPASPYQIWFHHQNSIGQFIARATILPTDDTWYYLACTHDYTNMVNTIYVNCVSQATFSWTIPEYGIPWQGSGRPVQVAGSTQDGISRCWGGSIFDVRLYNRVLSSNERMTIYRANGKDNIINGMVLKTAIGGNAGVGTTIATDSGIMKDYSSYKNNGTVSASSSDLTWEADPFGITRRILR